MFAHTERRAPRAQAFTLIRHVARLAVLVALAACGGAASLNLAGSAKVSNGVLVLTNGGGQISSAWNSSKQRLSAGWETNFQFQVAGAGCSSLADGFAFVMQNGSATALASGTAGSDLGYSGMKSALAIEFDVFQSSGYPDGDANHIAVVPMASG